MKIQYIDETIINDVLKTDTIDVPDCLGEFNKKNRLCSQYCCIAIKCCVMHSKNLKIDIMEQLLNESNFAIKLQ